MLYISDTVDFYHQMTNSGFETPVRYNNITPITIDEFCFTEMKVLIDNKRNKRTA
jgi:hypothetical protein